jgi:hypothetical protein
MSTLWKRVKSRRPQRTAQKCVDEEAAEDLRTEVLKEIRRGQFNITAMRASRAAEVVEQKPKAPTPRRQFWFVEWTTDKSPATVTFY